MQNTCEKSGKYSINWVYYLRLCVWTGVHSWWLPNSICPADKYKKRDPAGDQNSHYSNVPFCLSPLITAGGECSWRSSLESGIFSCFYVLLFLSSYFAILWYSSLSLFL